MILLLAGTSEGRETAVAMGRKGYPLIVATATEYGKELLKNVFHGEIIAGRLDLEAMLELISGREVIKIIDATHPFATNVTATAREACQITGITYERQSRADLDHRTDHNLRWATDASEAAMMASKLKGDIFLTTGSKTLGSYVQMIEPARLIVRILPLPESLNKCLALGISPAKIIAMQGPFDYELNILLFRRFSPALVIAKDSGLPGGTAEKIKAASDLKIPLILIARPVEMIDF